MFKRNMCIACLMDSLIDKETDRQRSDLCVSVCLNADNRNQVSCFEIQDFKDCDSFLP